MQSKSQLSSSRTSAYWKQ